MNENLDPQMSEDHEDWVHSLGNKNEPIDKIDVIFIQMDEKCDLLVSEDHQHL